MTTDPAKLFNGILADHAASQAAVAPAPRCEIPPDGWECAFPLGHYGPCHTIVAGWASAPLAQAYGYVQRLRDQLAQDPESGIDAALKTALEAIEAADVEIAQVQS